LSQLNPNVEKPETRDFGNPNVKKPETRDFGTILARLRNSD